MIKHLLHYLPCLLIAGLFTVQAVGGEKPPKETIPKKAISEKNIRWDLTDLYSSDKAWEKAYDQLVIEIEKSKKLQDQFTGKAANLASTLEAISSIRKPLGRLYIYARLLNDEDQRVTASQAKLAKADALYSRLEKATAWLSPAILELGEKQIKAYVKKEKRLSPFAFYLKNLLRSASHTLDQDGEALLRSALATESAPSNTYQLLTTTDIPWPTVELSDGQKVVLNKANYTRYRSSLNRQDRKLVFDRYWSTWKKYENTLGALLSTEVQGNLFEAKARRYPSALAQRLGRDNLPEAVYTTMMKEVNAGLPVLHRYLRLRGRMLGVKQLHYYDIYPALVNSKPDFSVKKSRDIALASLKPLGKAYNQHLKTALDSNWAHVYPQEGKRAGAYMIGSAYDVHPYVLLNHNDDYSSLSLFVHEWGHAVHSLFANTAQPFEMADYATFIAEIASNINEVLMDEYLINQAKTKQEKLFYLGQSLDSIRTSLFRQAMFAEFELAIHQEAEKGKPLTGAIFSKIFGDIIKKYHDHEGGTMIIDDVNTMEWAYVPQYFREFYTFQYSTSISGATWFAERLSAGDTKAQDAFIDVLKAGGSDYAYNLLKDKAGLDMASPEPYRAVIRRMSDLMDRIEALLDSDA